MSQIHSIVLAGTAATLLLGGCATRGQVTQLEERVDQLSQQVASLNGNLDRSLQVAQNAEAEARRSAERADAAARTADAIFGKRVTK